MFDRDRGVKCNGTGITGSGDFIRFKGLYAERRKNSTSGYSGSRYIGGCERVIDSDAAERMIAGPPGALPIYSGIFWTDGSGF